MNLSKYFSRFYAKVFIAINILPEKIEIQTLVVKNSKEISKESKKFDTTSLEDEEIVKYIKKMELISPFYYISTLDRSNEQGIVPTCSHVEAKNYIDTSISKLLCIRDEYSLFTSKTDFDRQKKEFETIGLDYIFSPTNILENIFSDKLETNSAAFIFIQESSLMLLAINRGRVSFSDFKLCISDNEQEETSLDDVSLNDDDDLDFDLDLDDDDDFGVDLEDMEANDIDGDDLDDLDDLDDFNDDNEIEDLDDLDSSSDDINEITDFDESGTEDTLNLDDESEEESRLSSANLDYDRYQIINTMIRKYYNDPKYKNDFIETIFIANAGGVGSDLKAYLEDELYISVITRNINTLDELNRLAQREVQSES